MEAPQVIYDRRPLYPEHIAINLPLGTVDRLKEAADQAGLTVAQFIRQAVLAAAASAISGGK